MDAQKKGPRDPYRLINTSLNGRYHLLEYTGGGGMGAVYRAADAQSGEVVAVKILKPDIVTKNPEYIELFGKEVTAAQQLRHDNIVRLLDNGIDDDIAYMVMEWLDGSHLEDVVSEERLPLERVVTIFEQVCSAITCAHDNNVIHLDLKPANLMLVRRGRASDLVKVIDFGLARVIRKESGTTVTRFRGTHQFCAPEQFGGRVSRRSDIYSLGATLYYLISGLIPFSTSYINAKMHPNLELPEVPSPTRHRDLPSAIDNVIRRALSKDPGSRQQSARQLFEEFYLATLVDTPIPLAGIIRKGVEAAEEPAGAAGQSPPDRAHDPEGADLPAPHENPRPAGGPGEQVDAVGKLKIITPDVTPLIDKARLSFAVPIAVVLSKEVTELCGETTPSGERFREDLAGVINALYYDFGVSLPSCYVSDNAPLKANDYFIAIKEAPIALGSVEPGCVYVTDTAENLKVFGIEGKDSLAAALKPGAWIPAAQRHLATAAGLVVLEPTEVIVRHFSEVMKGCVHEFLGIQEVQTLLDFVAQGAPRLVEDVVPQVVPLDRLTDILRRLVEEGISIRDLKTILEALSEWGRIETDPVMLTEYVRASMRRYITFRYTRGRDTLFVYLLDPEIEDLVRGAIRRTAAGSYLSLDPAVAHEIISAVGRELGDLPPASQKPIIITDMELRRFVRKMVAFDFPALPVISYQELGHGLNVQPVGRISLRPQQS